MTSQTKAAPLWVRIFLVAVLAVAAVPGWLFVAGHAVNWLLFHKSAQLPPITLITWPLYFKHYNNDPQTHSYLVLSGFAASLVFLSPLALLFLRPKRSLHGDARWAKRSEITSAE